MHSTLISALGTKSYDRHGRILPSSPNTQPQTTQEPALLSNRIWDEPGEPGGKEQEGNGTRVGSRATVRPQLRQRDRKQTYKKQKIPLATRQRDHFLKGASLKISRG